MRLHDPQLEKVDGDALDRHAIELALAGSDAVIQTLGVSPNPEHILRGTRLFSEATRILVDAMEAKGVKRLISVTGLGAGNSRGHGGLFYNAALWCSLGVSTPTRTAGVDHTPEPSGLDDRSPERPDHRTRNGNLPSAR